MFAWKNSHLFLKYIILERIAKGTLAILLGVGGLSLVHADLSSLVRNVAHNLNIDIENALIGHILHAVGLISPVWIKVISFGGVVYGLANYAVAWGLHKRYRWAEYMTILEISAFIPVEVYALDGHFSWFRLSAFALNVAIVVYLIRNRSLFHPMKEEAGMVETSLPRT